MDEVINLLPSYFSGISTDADKNAVESWIAASESNRKTFDQLKEIWERSEQVTDTLSFQHENAWERIKFGTGIEDRNPQKLSLLSKYRILLKVAASIVLLISIGLLIKLSIFNDPKLITVSTGGNEKLEICLADGSTVYLNRSSQLKYPEKFNKTTREIELYGEAFFQVAKDPKHPFIVHANGSNTKVLGTSFNINAKNPNMVSISVFSGKVAFSYKEQKEKAIILLKGENGTFNRSNFTISKEIGDNYNTIAWQTGILKFNKTSLAEAAKTLSEYYAKTIVVAPQIQNRLITVTLNNQPLEKVLEILELTLDIKADTTSKQITLSPFDL